MKAKPVKYVKELKSAEIAVWWVLGSAVGV
jgi:hypothetical protein